MVKDLQDYALDYFALCVALGVGTFLYISYMEDRVMQQIIALGIALTYVLWGVIHHHHADKVTGKIVLEYVLIALFGLLSK